MNQNPSTRAPSAPVNPSPVRRTCLVTGASAGIGEAFAEVFARNGFNLVITARRGDRLDAVAARLRETYGIAVDTIVDDLADNDAPARLCAAIAAKGIAINALVNNAGYGVPGVYTASPWERHAAFLQVMVVGVAELTYRLLPGMIERGYGRIINVGSLAGLVPAPAGHTLYGASKAFVIKFSEALAHEVGKHGVHVTALCPGFTYSEFHDVTGTRAQMNRLPRWMWMNAPEVAQQGFDAVMAGTPIQVTGWVNRAVALLVRWCPQAIVNQVSRRMGAAYRKT
jgi:short-subunit dehydrogenase